MYAKVHWIFQNPPRKPQSHQNSDDFGIINIDLIFAVFGIDFHQNSDDFGINIDLIYAVFGIDF